MRGEIAFFILFLPVGYFLLNAVTVFAIFVNMIIVAPYYSLIKRLRLYYRVKKQRRLMKEHPQRFCFFEKSGKEKERVPQNLALETQISSYSLKKMARFFTQRLYPPRMPLFHHYVFQSLCLCDFL